MSGYVRIHRRLLGHAAFRNDAEAMAFAWMVMKAAWRPCRVRYKGRALNLLRGQLSVSQRDMAKALDRDKAWVERLWKRLRDEAMVKVDREAGVALITICNYEDYQALTKEGEAVDEAGARQGRGTEQEIEEKEEKKAGAARYAFSGRVIRLVKKDFDNWRSTYHKIPDLRAELTSIDAWLQGQPEAQQKRWFHSVPGMLGRKHQEALRPAEETTAYRQEPLRV